MNAADLQAYLQSLAGDWKYPEDTVDTFKIGTPETPVRGIAVGWMSYMWALEEAQRLGCNVFVTHEPTFYNHRDRERMEGNLPFARAKRAWLEACGMVVLRCHDLWDQAPGIGIPDSWGNALGFADPLDGDEHVRVYDGGGRTALQIAQQVAAAVRPFGQEAVQLIGPEDRLVRRVCTGTGAITPFFRYIMAFSADMGICTDDGLAYWKHGAYAVDAGIPLLVVHHHVSEEAGVRSLAAHLRQAFPQIPVHYVPQRCMYRLVTVQG